MTPLRHWCLSWSKTARDVPSTPVALTFTPEQQQDHRSQPKFKLHRRSHHPEENDLDSCANAPPVMTVSDLVGNFILEEASEVRGGRHQRGHRALSSDDAYDYYKSGWTATAAAVDLPYSFFHLSTIRVVASLIGPLLESFAFPKISLSY